MENSKLPDTPWHIGFAKKEDDDPRRHKARCVNLRGGVCTFGKSGCYTLKCSGSSHCIYYAENENQFRRVIKETSSAEEEATTRALSHRQRKKNEWRKIQTLGKEEINNRFHFFRHCPICQEKLLEEKGIKICEYCGFNSECLDEMTLKNLFYYEKKTKARKNNKKKKQDNKGYFESIYLSDNKKTKPYYNPCKNFLNGICLVTGYDCDRRNEIGCFFCQ